MGTPTTLNRLRDEAREALFRSNGLYTELELAVHPFLDNPLVAIAPIGHALAARAQLTLADLTGERWRQTLALLDSVPPERHEAVVEGALETFALLLQWLEPAVVAAHLPGG